MFNAVFTSRRRARGMFPGCPGDLRYGEEALHKPAVGTGVPGWSLFGLSTPSPSAQMGCLPEACPAPQSGEPTSAFCTRSLRWVPSQYGAFWVALQVQRATTRVSWALNLSGDRPVRWKKWEPSQKGCEGRETLETQPHLLGRGRSRRKGTVSRAQAPDGDWLGPLVYLSASA